MARSASGAALNGNRTTTPERSATSAIGSATTQTGTNAGDRAGGDGPGSAARIRRERSQFDRVSRRARQKALAVCHDRFQASIVARQAQAFSWAVSRHDGVLPMGKTHGLLDRTRRHFTGHLRLSRDGSGRGLRGLTVRGRVTVPLAHPFRREPHPCLRRHARI
jgi:hypothetical protein